MGILLRRRWSWCEHDSTGDAAEGPHRLAPTQPKCRPLSLQVSLSDGKGMNVAGGEGCYMLQTRDSSKWA